MRKFKVGDKLEILEPEEMGVDARLKAGDIVTIKETYFGGRDGWCDHGFTYDPGWVEDGFIRFVE